MNAPRTRVTVESLESRQLLSASLTPSGQLIVSGDPAVPNTITVGLNADASSVDVSVDGAAVQSFDASAVKRLVVITGDGGDTVSIDESQHVFTVKTRVFGGAGADSIQAGGEDDYITGGAGNDTISAGAGNNFVFGNAGDDSITATGGDNDLNGGAGADVVSGDGTGDTLSGGRGPDSLNCGAGTDLATGGKGADTLAGGSGSATLLGGAGPDMLHGGGHDILDGGLGINDLTGDGTDTLAGVRRRDHVHNTGDDMITRDPAPVPDVPAPPVHSEPVNPPAATDLGIVTGIVTDSTGTAVPDASVVLRTVQQTEDGDSGGFEIAASFETTTDAQGQFTFSNVPVGDYVALAGKKDVGVAHADATVTKDKTTTLTLGLEPFAPPAAGVGSVGGTVVDGSNAPVSGATVILAMADPNNDSAPQGAPSDVAPIDHPHGPLKTTTDANGAYSFANVPAGQYVAIVIKPGVGVAHVGVSVTPNTSATADVTLTDPTTPPPVVGDVGTVSGVVKDGDGNPVANASVALFRNHQGTGGPTADSDENHPPERLIAQTDDAGHFTLPNVPVGTYTLVAGKVGAGLTHMDGVVVTKDATTTENITLTKIAPPPPVTGTGSITGTVKDGNGAAVTDATVVLAVAPTTDGPVTPPGPTGGPSAAAPPSRVIMETTTGDGGAFSFDNVPAGDYILFAGLKGVGVAHVDVTVAADGTLTESLTLVAPSPEPTM